VNLFRVLQDDRMGFQLLIKLMVTPFARDEFEIGYIETDEPVERARRLVILSYMGFGSNGHSRLNRTGFRSNSDRLGTTPAHDWANYPKVMPAIIERLRGVVIENRDALAVMAQHDGPDTLHYVDPPYMRETRSIAKNRTGCYTHELDADGHARLLAFLPTLAGMVVVSGYPHSAYDAAFVGWRRVEIGAHADGGADRREVIWINPAAWARGHDLFAPRIAVGDVA
jgi:DNA adenine methylase